MCRHHEDPWEGVYERVQVRKPDVDSKKTLITLWTADVFGFAVVEPLAPQVEGLSSYRLDSRAPDQDLPVRISFLRHC